MTAADLFEPCDRYRLDPHRGLQRRLREVFRGRPAPSCVDCREQYLPGRVCETFRARLLVLGGWEATGGR